ncbi:ankyrin repeat domain-containing protein [Candidatus Dependentiae bacterium]|nr:MAG: ankyrin repeat domain-containing protein [Candidatus Dependentiae bacterium]
MKKAMNGVFFAILMGIIPTIDAMHVDKSSRHFFLPVMHALPPSQAIRQGNYQEIETFLKQEENKCSDFLKDFFLHLAAIHGRKDIASLLLEKGANVNVQNLFGETPLHLAAIHGRKDIASLLLEKGANVNAKDCSGKTPTDRALQHVSQKDREKVKLLLNGTNVNGVFEKQMSRCSGKENSPKGGSRLQKIKLEICKGWL